MSDVTVTVTANPQPYIEGMNTAASATEGAASSISASVAQIESVAQAAIASAQRSMAQISVSVIDTAEQARIATASWNQAKAQIAEAERVLADAEAQHTTRIREMIAASMQQIETDQAVAQSARARAEAETVAAAGGREAYLEQLAAADQAAVAARAAAEAEAAAVPVKEASAVASKQLAVATREAAAANEQFAISSRTSYEIGVAFSLAASGNFARMQRTIAALGNSTGILKEFAAVVAGIGPVGWATAAAVAALGVAWIEGTNETTAYNKAIVSTDNSLGLTIADVRSLGEEIGNSMHNYSGAREALLGVAQSGKVLSDDFAEVSRGVVALSELTGKTIEQIVADFAKLADDPTKNVQKLNEAYHFLTLEQFQSIDAMQKAGDVAEATSVAQRILAEESIKRLQEVMDKMPPLVQWWYNLRDAANMAWDAMKHVGSSEVDEQMDSLQSKIMLLSAARDRLAQLPMDGMFFSARGAVEALDKQIGDLKSQWNDLNATAQDFAREEGNTAAAKAREAAEHAAAISAQTDLDALMQRFDKTDTAAQRVAKATQDLYKIFMDQGQLPQGMFAHFDDQGTFSVTGSAWDELVQHINKGTDAYREAQKELKAYNEAVKQYEPDQDRVNKLLEDLSDKGDKGAEAWAKYNDAMDKLDRAFDKQLDDDLKAIDNAQTLADKTAAQAKYEEDLANSRTKTSEVSAHLLEVTEAMIASYKDFNGIMAEMRDKYAQEENLDAMTTEQRKVATEVIKAETAALKELRQVHPGANLTSDQIAQIEAEAAVHVKTEEAINQHKEALTGLINDVNQSFDGYANALAQFADGAIHGWKNLGQQLVQVTEQFVTQILAQLLRLMVFNGIENAIFGSISGYNALPTLSSLGGFSGLLNSAGGGGLSGSGAIPGGGTYNLLSADGSGGILNNLGNWALGSGGSTGFFNTSLSDMIGGGSGSWAGAIGSTLGGALGGFELGNKLGGTAGGLLGAGLGGYAAYSIPYVGWALGAMSLINSLTGGGLLGTDWKSTGVTDTDITVGPGGADVGNFIQESKKKALFGGRSWKTVDQPGTSDQISGAENLYTSILSNLDSFTAALNQPNADVVSGKYNIHTDSSGKQSFTSTIDGVEYKGDTQQQFAERIQAESFEKVLAGMGLDVGKFVDQFKQNADKYWAAVQDFAAATTQVSNGIASGFKFMAISGDQTIQSVMKFVEAQQAAGETLSQTYARLAQAQQQYTQFVKQFAPGVTYVDDFEAAYSQLYHQMLANVDAANKLAQAAGAEGASEQDLANIRAAATEQMAALVTQLQATSQSLAFTLGVSNVGTMDQVSTAIQDIINSAKKNNDVVDQTASSANSAAVAVGSFSNAMQQTAKSATDAINLLLGNLSILNDQQKLQVAMEGLREGTVTREQVLEIGQRLYASSEAYVNLFNQVMQYAEPSSGGGSSGSSRGGGRHSSSSSSSTTTDNSTPPKDWTDSVQDWIGTGLTQGQWNKMSDDDKQKLLDLITEHNGQVAAKTASDFNTLATQIAEIAAAKHEDVMQVLSDEKINLSALEKGLGLKSDAELKSFLEGIEKQKDSEGENTQSIVDAINALPTAIAAAIGGKPTTEHAGQPVPQPTAGDSGGANTVPSRGGIAPPGGRTPILTHEDAALIGTHVGRAVAGMLGRNIRTR